VEVVENKRVVYEFGKFRLDPRERTLVADGIPIHLAPKEFDTLLLFIEHNGRALTKDELMSAVWRDSVVDESNLARQISRLRKILNANGDPLIETIPKYGYRFSAVLRQAVLETEDPIILEQRTVKRVRLELDGAVDEVSPALLPARRFRRRLPALAAVVIVVTTLGLIGWHYVFRSRAPVIDPYAPVRLTDNPNDDTGPVWTKDGHIRFVRLYPDNHFELLTMNPDGTEQTIVKMPDGKQILGWSPDEQKIIYSKTSDPSQRYLSNVDGSGEGLLPFRPGVWSPDSSQIVYHQRVSGGDFDIFLYTIKTGKIRNLTKNEAFDVDPSFSPDGKKIVFASSRDGNPEIYSMNTDGSDQRRLTFNPGLDAHAAYSPDGTQIIFGSVRENENGDVYLMNTDGSDVVKVAGWDKSNEAVGPGCWSPDGTKILFTSDRNGKDDIYAVSAETVQPRVVISENANDLHQPSVSPDGRSIVYTASSVDLSGELKVFDLASGRTKLLKKTELSQVQASWSPDGQWIIFTDRPNGNSDVFRIKTDGTSLENLTNDPSQDLAPAISEDGTKIVFLSYRGDPNHVPRLFVMNADGTDQHPLTPRKGWEADPTWAPDGNEIVFSCDREDSPGNMMDICAINIDGTGERHLIFHRNYDAQPAVSPDGTRIAFASSADGNPEIYIMNRDGSGLRRLTRDPGEDNWPHWSPDGKSLYFSSDRAGRFAIYKIDLSFATD